MGRLHLALFWKRRERKSRFWTLVLVFFFSAPWASPVGHIPFWISAFPCLICLSSGSLLMPGNRIMHLSSFPSPQGRPQSLLLPTQPSLPPRLTWILFQEASLTYFNQSLSSPWHLQRELTTQGLGSCLIVSLFCGQATQSGWSLALCTSSALPMGAKLLHLYPTHLTDIPTYLPQPQLVVVLIKGAVRGVPLC